MKSPLIYIPRSVEGQIDSPKTGVQGLVGWELVRDGKVIKSSNGLQPNLITNNGLDLLSTLSYDGAIGSMNLGTGSTAPAVTDTALVAEVGTARRTATSRAGQVYVAGPPDYWYRRAVFTFVEAYANGNLTEVGLFGGAVMFARQLLKDGAGVPTTVTKTSLDQLIITYEYRWYMPTVDDVVSLTFSGVTYSVTTRSHAVSNYDNGEIVQLGPTSLVYNSQVLETDVLVARTGAHALGTTSTSEAGAAYSNGNYYKEYQSIFDPAVGNFATGIGMFVHHMVTYTVGGLFQSQFVPKIAKTNVKRLTLFVRRVWGRYP